MASLALTRTALGQAVVPGDDALREAARAFFAAIAAHPPAALEDLLDEGFAYRTSRGAVIGKRALIDHLSQGLTRVAATRSLRAVRTRTADTAVVTGVAEVFVEEADGQRAVWSRYTHVWVRREDRWRLLYREAGESAGRLPESEGSAPGLTP
jgi:ketosteroid isomerase-like protein